MYRACIFDLDGTLANTLYSIANFSNRALRACGYPTIDPEDFRKIVGDGADTQMRRMLTRVKGAFTEEELSHLRTIYDGYYAADPTDRIQPYDGMMDTLQQLHAKGIRLAVLSNKPHAWTVSIIQTMFGDKLFDCYYGQRAGIPKKPAPDGAGFYFTIYKILSLILAPTTTIHGQAADQKRISCFICRRSRRSPC